MQQADTWKTVIALWLADVFLFCATAAVVIWQNSRITVLYDLCGVLEPAYRMSLGDRPYADFPFPYAPLTFLIQSWIIRLWGTVYWHHIAYAAVVAGLCTVLAWRILGRIFRDSFDQPYLASFILSLPIIPLGVYCVFPHPFYDPDAMFFILVSIAFILWLERRGFPLIPTLVAGMLLVIPLFIKQNIGLAYLGSWVLVLAILMVIGVWKRQPVRGWISFSAGAAAGLAIAGLIVQATVGIETYKYWTWDFATLRRTPSPSDMLSVYADPMLAVWVLCIAAGVILFWINKSGRTILSLFAALLLGVPFVWPAIYLLIDTDASERGERLVNVWPVVLVSAFVLSVVAIRRATGVKRVLAFILIATAHGVFLSQQLWGSTYGIWPMFLILLGLCMSSVNELSDRRAGGWLILTALLASASLTTAGAFYIYSNDRLDYVDFEDGEMQQSSLPQLSGLSIRGDYLPQFEELVAYVNQNIPPDDGILALPGEDLFYYTTGRRPRFPALLFDVTNNPYSPEEIARSARERDIRWLIVKNDLQIEVDKTIDDKDHILELLKPDFKHIESLDNYEIYRRKQPGETDDEDEDDNDSGDEGDDSDQAK